MPLRRVLSNLRPVLYVQIREQRLKITNLNTGRVYNDAPLVAIETGPDGKKVVAAVGAAATQLSARGSIKVINPFSHPRTLLSDFMVAERLLMSAFQEVCGKSLLRPSPSVVMHPIEKLDGGLTAIEQKALRELAFGASARKVTVYEGEELCSRSLDFDALTKADPDIQPDRKPGQSPTFVAFLVVICIVTLLLSVFANV